jgi:hypothetical protein
MRSMRRIVPALPNVSRVTVNGSTSCPHEYLRLRVDLSSQDVFSHERVPRVSHDTEEPS